MYCLLCAVNSFLCVVVCECVVRVLLCVCVCRGVHHVNLAESECQCVCHHKTHERTAAWDDSNSGTHIRITPQHNNTDPYFHF